MSTNNSNGERNYVSIVVMVVLLLLVLSLVITNTSLFASSTETVEQVTNVLR